jgi:Photosystem II complex subunit Ycf12
VGLEARVYYLSKLIELSLGGAMDFLTNFLGGINFEAIVQLTCLALIVLAGPAVIFVLALRGGDL